MDTPAGTDLSGAPLDRPLAPGLAPLRIVIPRAKRERLLNLLRALGPRATCHVTGCLAEGLAVLVLESEQQAVLCPHHLLVGADGVPLPGEPVVAAGAW